MCAVTRRVGRTGAEALVGRPFLVRRTIAGAEVERSAVPENCVDGVHDDNDLLHDCFKGKTHNLLAELRIASSAPQSARSVPGL